MTVDKNKGILLYQIAGFDMEEYLCLYRNNVREKDIVEYEAFVPLADFLYTTGKIDEETWKKRKVEEQSMAEGATTHKKTQRGVFKSTERIIEKCQYLQDAIIRMATSKKDTMTFSLSSSILKSVIGHEYKRMIEVFIEMGILAIGSDFGNDEVSTYTYYKKGEYSTLYTLLRDDFETVRSLNSNIRKYKEKTKQEYEKIRALATTEAANRYGQNFADQYNASLRKIKIADEHGLDKYIAQTVRDNPKGQYYYNYVKESLTDKNKAITRIDNAGRIYHCLTNLDREVKPFLNIDFMLDCKNSHPVLFNYFIFRAHKIGYEASYRITEFLKSRKRFEAEGIPFSLTRQGHVLKKGLIDAIDLGLLTDVHHSDIEKMEEDEAVYIWLTSRGELWDEIAKANPQFSRDEIKVEMFKQVFYSHRADVRQTVKPFAYRFKKTFPNVFKLISTWKKQKQDEGVKAFMDEHKLVVKDPSVSLSVAMMHIEACIFTTILKKTYSKRWNALHIHDCIVIPQDGNKNHPTIEQVRSIMEDVYKDFGLCPTFS